MKHCKSFAPLDIWYLHDDEIYSEKIFKFGICPICQKPIAVYIKFNNQLKIFEQIKKIGFAAQKMYENLKPEINFSASKLNLLKFKPQTYKWVYGVNTQTSKSVKQYAKDFFGNKVLVKKIKDNS